MQKDVSSRLLVDRQGTLAQEPFLRFAVFRLLSDGKINEAENLLFEELESSPHGDLLLLATDFYEKVNRLDDNTLAACDFSREEIAEGLYAVKSKLGYGA